MSLAEQLRNVHLKSPSEPMKDYSDPRKCGFVSDTEIVDYHNSVLDVNTELWLERLADVTFPTEYCTIEPQEAKLFISIFERLYRNLDPSGISQVGDNHCEYPFSLPCTKDSGMLQVEHVIPT